MDRPQPDEKKLTHVLPLESARVSPTEAEVATQAAVVLVLVVLTVVLV